LLKKQLGNGLVPRIVEWETREIWREKRDSRWNKIWWKPNINPLIKQINLIRKNTIKLYKTRVNSKTYERERVLTTASMYGKTISHLAVSRSNLCERQREALLWVKYNSLPKFGRRILSISSISFRGSNGKIKRASISFRASIKCI